MNQYLLYPKQTHYLYATPFKNFGVGGIEPPTRTYETLKPPDYTPQKKTYKKKKKEKKIKGNITEKNKEKKKKKKKKKMTPTGLEPAKVTT